MFTLPALSYSYDSLEPHFDAQTMELHFTKHHQGYVDKLNAAVEGTAIADKPLEEILSTISTQAAAVRNNGGGHYNHTLFWSILSPQGGTAPAQLQEQMTAAFGSFDECKRLFTEAAMTRFGSGWAWLVVDGQELKIGSTPNQDNPLMDVSDFKGTPILGVDVWEHAYYLKYQNRRAEYLEAFWQLINWPEVLRRYQEAVA